MIKTIKDLCNETALCICCPFKIICPDYVCPADFDDDENKNVTNAIIETARRLEEIRNESTTPIPAYISIFRNSDRRS